MTNLSHISANITQIQNEIAQAAQRAGRDPKEITLVAVTKTYPVQFIREVHKAGLYNVGENRVQEAVPKIETLRDEGTTPPLTWHLIGHLQSNKARLAVQHFDLIHSVDSLKLAKEINRHAVAAEKTQPILVQVNVSGEETKSGIHPGNAVEVIGEILELCPNVPIHGLMTMAPLGTAEAARPTFTGLRNLRDRLAEELKHPGFDPRHLSMGMSNDFRVAIEEGATLVRIGSALFGERNYH